MTDGNQQATVQIPFRGSGSDALMLTDFRASDRADVVRRINDPEIYRYTLRIPYPYAELDFEHWMVRVAEATQRHGSPAHLAIRERGSVIGCCGFDDLETGEQAEIGYWLGQDRWGRGVMSAAVRAACEYAFSTWNLTRILAHAMPENVASTRVLERNGFVFQGKDHHVKAGQPIESRLYELARRGF